ncbi:sulfurtransferase [Qipengyuania zhejiangensis]|uniref:sulfurtransferase n=1 Tax=Qipengyuania zhejiangensis TaxID=3077782 RepID=UPI002D7928D1|nr:sulfurtransferase [Qipengyuania sp. Z2]
MDILLSTQSLEDRLGAADLVVIDATMHLPDSGRDAEAEFAERHIPGARFLNLATFVDTASSVPKALPTGQIFADRLGALGVGPGTQVVLYDDSQIRSSARAWFIFDHFGFKNVAVLDGGLAKWRSEGRALETGVTPVAPVAVPVPEPRRAVRAKADMLDNCETSHEQVVDARDAARFAGEAGSGSAGHIPGAVNLHFPRLFADDGSWKSAPAIRAEFEGAGIDLSRPVTASCNSGMTACVLLLGLEIAGKGDGGLYDGSWMEWGEDADVPKEKGAGR